MQQQSHFGLENHGLNNEAIVHWNLGQRRSRGNHPRKKWVHGHGGALVVETGAYTGRSANDKFIIEEDQTRDNIGGAVNKPNTEARFDALRLQMLGICSAETYTPRI